MTTTLEAGNLGVDRGGVAAVRNVDLRVEEGTWLGLIGANGSGKTSLLRAIAGRLPIACGRCVIDGEELGNDRARRAAAIGFAPSIEMLPSALRGSELLRIVAGSTAAALDNIGPLRGALGIDRLLDRPVGSCSAGMRQRIALACAFAERRRIVILDEPFNWLDAVAAYDTRHALRAMVAEGITLVTALHDLTALVTGCDSGMLLSAGAVALTMDEAAIEDARRDMIGFEQHTITFLRKSG
jgi:ABC-2 type transport system ATP-binding protein